MNQPLQTLKGFRDFLPEEKRRRDYVLAKIIEIFKLYGFDPLETPTIEYSSLLLGKYGTEADKLVYTFKDKGDRDVALRYDQTVPSARILTQYQNELPKYFRRYQIQNVFRAENPQKGRYREFTQCDIDIFGSTSPLADAEIIATTYFAYKNVGYPTVNILINDREVLFNTLQPFAQEVNILSIIQTLDKLDKIGEEKVVTELVTKGLDEQKAKEALKTIQSASISEKLQTIIDYTIALGVPKERLLFTSYLARGLDYYTGMIFEVVLPEYTVGACGGGGRYDKLIGQLGGVEIPAVGIAFGFDRMVDAAQDLNIIPPEQNITQVLVAVFNQETLKESLEVAQKLRKANIATEILPASNDKLDKQFKYADAKKIPYVVLIGPEEVSQKVVKLKNMKTGEQETLSLEEVIKKLKK